MDKPQKKSVMKISYNQWQQGVSANHFSTNGGQQQIIRRPVSVNGGAGYARSVPAGSRSIQSMPVTYVVKRQPTQDPRNGPHGPHRQLVPVRVVKTSTKAAPVAAAPRFQPQMAVPQTTRQPIIPWHYKINQNFDDIQSFDAPKPAVIKQNVTRPVEQTSQSMVVVQNKGSGSQPQVRSAQVNGGMSGSKYMTRIEYKGAETPKEAKAKVITEKVIVHGGRMTNGTAQLMQMEHNFKPTHTPEERDHQRSNEVHVDVNTHKERVPNDIDNHIDDLFRSTTESMKAEEFDHSGQEDNVDGASNDLPQSHESNVGKVAPFNYHSTDDSEKLGIDLNFDDDDDDDDSSSSADVNRDYGAAKELAVYGMSSNKAADDRKNISAYSALQNDRNDRPGSTQSDALNTNSETSDRRSYVTKVNIGEEGQTIEEGSQEQTHFYCKYGIIDHCMNDLFTNKIPFKNSFSFVNLFWH